MRPEAYLDVALEIWNESGETTVCSLEGSCMAPVLQEGDRLTIRHGNGTLRPGDIAVFRSSEGILVNRVLAREEREGAVRYTLRADRSPLSPREIAGEDLLGRVISVENAEGIRNLETRSERWLARYLAFRSRVSGKAARPDSLPWRCVRLLVDLRARLLPGGCSLSLLPYRVLRRWSPARRPPPPPAGGNDQKEARQNG